MGFDANAVNVIAVGEHAVAAIVPGRRKILLFMKVFKPLNIIMIGHIKMSRQKALYTYKIYNILQPSRTRPKLASNISKLTQIFTTSILVSYFKKFFE